VFVIITNKMLQKHLRSSKPLFRSKEKRRLKFLRQTVGKNKSLKTYTSIAKHKVFACILLHAMIALKFLK